MEAIKAGMQPGLTIIVGPPGTGKTDVAVQIISNIYHNWPQQRTLIVTHSNLALNQLFEKIMALDVDERHLLRMGRYILKKLSHSENIAFEYLLLSYSFFVRYIIYRGGLKSLNFILF